MDIVQEASEKSHDHYLSFQTKAILDTSLL
jgi:hypothetical protein